MPRREPSDDPAWLFEPKYDGYRGHPVGRFRLPRNSKYSGQGRAFSQTMSLLVLVGIKSRQIL
jgi:hypothetical protein